MADGKTTQQGADGRRLRSERSRDAVVDALLSWFDDGVVQPGAALIADRAGVSERSVFRHFDDLEALAAAAIDRQWAKVGAAFEAPPAAASSRERIAALVDQRLRIHDRVMPAARAGMRLATTPPTVAAAVDARRRLLRDQVGHYLGPDLGGRAPSERTELLHALDVALSLDAVEYLRGSAGLSRRATRAVLIRTASALLGSGR